MTIKLAETTRELEQLLSLQQANLPENISAEERASNGFVTVRHSLELLHKMNEKAPQIIAVDNDRVVAYALVMVKDFSTMIPVLAPMFRMFETISFQEKKVCDYNYYVMGQICVGKGYRGIGVFDQLYQKHKETYSAAFDICLTEVSTSNSRSMNAHTRCGFQVVHTFRDDTDEWNILLWDWR